MLFIIYYIMIIVLTAFLLRKMFTTDSVIDQIYCGMLLIPFLMRIMMIK